ncbi:MAG: adenylosuccinate synthase [Flavobacteriales bacterium]|nr:adenylosuccinate synthase [Flavobacteriales bacterium]
MVDVLLGLQWGDEGKGKIVDYLTPNYDIVARFQGGPNAGHSLHFNGKKFVLNTIPSGIFRESCVNVIGNGVVADPVRLKVEIENILAAGTDVKSNLLISKKAHIIVPTHRILDIANEASKGDKKIGSTLRGIGPTYMDKTGRNGLRLGDIISSNFEQQYRDLVNKHLKLIHNLNYFDFDLEELEKPFFEALEFLRTFKLIDSEYYLNNALSQNKKILAEGAQGSLLDIDFGSYPYVTSSNTTAGGVCNGLGIPPRAINKVKGIFKAYCTRVGSGPFPTELNNEMGEKLRKNGNEFGATTGRPRRTGWLDLPALHYSVMINGVDELIMMKSDVLSGVGEVKVCTSYRVNEIPTSQMPFDACNVEIEPVYESFEGWNDDLTVVRNFEDLPLSFRNYCKEVSVRSDCKIGIVSVGPDREETILC